LHDNGGSSGSGTANAGISAELAAQMAQTIDKLAARVESFAAGLEEQAPSA
jgi:hypothetical protein